MKVQTVGIEMLQPSALREGLPRPRPDAALLDTVRRYGPLELPIVRTLAPQRYEILIGVETWIAVQRAGRYTLPVSVRDDLTDEDAGAIVAASMPLDPVSDAEQLQRLLGASGGPRSVAALARRTGRQRSSVAHALRLLELPRAVLDVIRDGRLGAGHGKALLAARTRADRTRLAELATDRRWSVRRLEAEIRGDGGAGEGADDVGGAIDPDVARLESHLGEEIGSRVAIDTARNTLTIHYADLNVLDGIVQRLVPPRRDRTPW